MPPIADAADERDRQGNQREQAESYGDAAEYDGAAGGAHGGMYRCVVVAAAGNFLPPAGDQQQRVVDRDAEADQADKELDDEVDVHQVGQTQDGQECGSHRGGRDQKRHHGEQRGEDKSQDRERAQCADQDLVKHARATGGTAGVGQRCDTGHLDPRSWGQVAEQG
jgi:hypothetical protein